MIVRTIFKQVLYDTSSDPKMPVEAGGGAGRSDQQQAHATRQLHRGVAVHERRASAWRTRGGEGPRRGYPEEVRAAHCRRSRSAANDREAVDRGEAKRTGDAREVKGVDKGESGDVENGDVSSVEGIDNTENNYAQRSTRDWRYYHAGPRYGGDEQEKPPANTKTLITCRGEEEGTDRGIVAAPAELQAQALSNFARVIMSSTAALPSAEKWCELRGLPRSQAPSVVTVARHLHQLSSCTRSSSKDWKELLNSTFQPVAQ